MFATYLGYSVQRQRHVVIINLSAGEIDRIAAGEILRLSNHPSLNVPGENFDIVFVYAKDTFSLKDKIKEFDPLIITIPGQDSYNIGILITEESAICFIGITDNGLKNLKCNMAMTFYERTGMFTGVPIEFITLSKDEKELREALIEACPNFDQQTISV